MNEQPSRKREGEREGKTKEIQGVRGARFPLPHPPAMLRADLPSSPHPSAMVAVTGPNSEGWEGTQLSPRREFQHPGLR